MIAEIYVCSPLIFCRARGIIPLFCVTFAVMTSLIASFWCESVKFTSDRFPTLRYGLWYQEDFETTAYTVNDGEDLVIEVNQECRDYDEGYDINGMWKFARACSVIAPLLGGILGIPLFFSAFFYYLSEGSYRSLAFVYIFVITTLQGCTFLIFRTSLCKDGVAPILNRIAELLGRQGVYSSSCEWDGGSSANVVATVLWFLTGAFMLSYYPRAPPTPPAETQTITYEKTVNEDGAVMVAETKIVKGTVVEAPSA